MLTLTLVALASYAGLNLPTVSYIKCLDVWSITCLLFVAAALLDCVIIDFLQNLHTKRGNILGAENGTQENEILPKDHKMEDCVSIEIHDALEQNVSQNINANSKMDMNRKCVRIALGMKCFSRFIFPLLFLIFNVLFWYMYTNGSGSFQNYVFH